MTEQEELNYLIQNSPASLPDDPSSSGWSTAQIKAKFYDGLFFLYNLFKQNRTNLTGAVNDMQNIVNTINEAYANILTGETVKAKYDEDNNVIKDTYAKILNITNGTISVLKYKKENGTDTDFVYNIEKNLTTLTTAFNTLKTWTDNLKSTTSEESVLRAVQATKDSLGNVIKDTYATVTSVSLLNTAITNIINGTTIVDKAYKDMDGNRIDTTYVKIANIVNALNDTSTNKPLSAAQGKALKDMIDAINTVLSSDTTTLDTLQEVVNYIKNNKSLIDGITISKMAFTDLVKNLTTNNDNLPLAASQGYALKAMIDAINDVEDGIEAAEALRVIAEAGRVEAEEARQTGYSGFDGRITANTNAISGIKDGTNLDSFSDVESALSDKADSSDVYDKTEVYTKVEAEALINAKCKETADNLQWQLGTYDLGVETVNGTTSLLPTPANTIQATMVRIYGASDISENLIVLNDVAETTTNGITYSIKNGVITLNGTATANININLVLKSTQYPTGIIATFNSQVNSNVSIYNLKSNGAWGSIGFGISSVNRTYTINDNTDLYGFRLYIKVDTEVSNFVLKPMYVSGSTAPTEFKVGFSGIHNLELSSLKVEGANLISTTDYTMGGDAYNATITITKQLEVGTTYTISFDTAISSNLVLTNATLVSASGYISRTSIVFTPTDNNVVITFAGGSTSNNLRDKLNNMAWYMLNYGSTALDYVPYITPTTKTIDLTSIEDSGGNKLFADGKLREDDYITPTEQKSVRNAVDLGSLNGWIYDEGQQRFAIVDAFGDAKFPNENTTVSNITISKDGYTAVSYKSIYTAPYTDMRIAAAIINNHNYFSIRDLRYNTVEAFKTAMSGVMLEYERTTPLVSNTNLSQLVKFEAHSNGSITLVNTNNQDTTSTFKYLKEVAK